MRCSMSSYVSTLQELGAWKPMLRDENRFLLSLDVGKELCGLALEGDNQFSTHGVTLQCHFQSRNRLSRRRNARGKRRNHRSRFASASTSQIELSFAVTAEPLCLPCTLEALPRKPGCATHAAASPNAQRHRRPDLVQKNGHFHARAVLPKV
jgi:hypothetical protein